MKSMITKIAYSLVLSLALFGSAGAAELYSPPLRVELGQSLECKILNTSPQARKIQIRIGTDENGLASDALMPPTMLLPGHVFTWANSAGPCFDTFDNDRLCIPSWCRFEVKGAKANFRASACVRDAGGVCRAAVEAR